MILVTGSGGFIGSAVVRRFAPTQLVVGFDSKGPPFAPPEADGFQVDLSSQDSVERALSELRRRHGSHVDAVIHLAAYYDFTGRANPKYDAVTVGGSERLLRGLMAGGFELGQFLFMSTMLVHRPCRPGERITEDWPLKPRWPYPESKVKTERLLGAIHGGVPLLVLRVAGVYDDDCHSIPIAHQIHHIYERWLLSHLFPGDPSHGQAFVHLDDLVSAIALAVERRRELPPELALLIGEPATLSYRRLQDMIGLGLYGRPWTTMRIPKTAAMAGAWARARLPFRPEPLIQPRVIPFADDHYALDVSRARARLGWEPARSLGDSLPRMLDFLERDPEGWYRENKIAPPSWMRKPAGAAR